MLITATPHDPLLARDSRPFGSGGRVRLLEWLYPSVVTGSLRTCLGKQMGGFNEATVAALKALQVRGPLPFLEGELYVPHPLDAVLKKEHDASRRCLAVRPQGTLAAGEGTNVPDGLRLAGLSGLGMDEEDFKPEKPPAFWAMKSMIQWLVAPDGREDLFAAPPSRGAPGPRGSSKDLPPGFLSHLAQDHRIHTALSPESGTVQGGKFFATAGLDFLQVCTEASDGTDHGTKKGYRQITVAVDATSQDAKFQKLLEALDTFHPLGGERRLAQWRHHASAPKELAWECPESLRGALDRSEGRVRMILATPGLFAGGWLPGWLGGGKTAGPGPWRGTPPGSDVELELVSAVVGRWKPLSGWSLEQGRVGPKPIRRLVPAGSVYFFKVVKGAPKALANLWLRSVCDEPQDRNDGFGSALWGLWNDAR